MEKPDSPFTANKQNHGDFTDTREIFRLLVEAVEDYAIFALDLNGNIISWNLGAQRLKGYKPDEIIGSNFRRFYTREDLDRNHPDFELKEAIAKGKYEEEGWRVRKDGTIFWANVVITPLKDETGRARGFVKVTRDLTERKKAEDNLRYANFHLEARVEERTRELSLAKIRAENAVRERDIFFSVASHELKTPIASLKLQTQLRRRSVDKGDYSDFEPEKLAELCTDDERQVERLAMLVDNMFDVAKITSGNFQLQVDECNLTELTHQSLKRMLPVLKDAGVECTFNAAEEIRGRWDRLRLEQVLTNLLSNVSKYAPGKSAEISLTKNHKAVQLSVQDHGPGLSRENYEKVFSPFSRVKEGGRASGLGLGLYITKQIVEAHGGAIRIESELGQGTKFIVSLPTDLLLDGE